LKFNYNRGFSLGAVQKQWKKSQTAAEIHTKVFPYQNNNPFLGEKN